MVIQTKNNNQQPIYVNVCCPVCKRDKQIVIDIDTSTIECLHCSTQADYSDLVSLYSWLISKHKYFK